MLRRIPAGGSARNAHGRYFRSAPESRHAQTGPFVVPCYYITRAKAYGELGTFGVYGVVYGELCCGRIPARAGRKLAALWEGDGVGMFGCNGC